MENLLFVVDLMTLHALDIVIFLLTKQNRMLFIIMYMNDATFFTE